MDFLVVGSVGLDDVETPVDKIKNALGGAATYISLTASYFTDPVKLIAVVGDDFPDEHYKMLEDHNVEMELLEIVKGGKTFRWGGRYHNNMNDRDTIFTDLNVFENFNPVIPEKSKKNNYVILGNILPSLQLQVLDQLKGDNFVICDTMNLWLEIAKDDLLKVLKRTDVLIINDSEARMLSDDPNLFKAAKIIKEMGPKYLIIKKGEHGALLFNEDKIFSAPAYPLESIFDPTGAGDTFLGGFAGHLHKTDNLGFENMKRAVIYGSVMASFNVEKFSTIGLEKLTDEKIQNRFNEFIELSRFDNE